MTESEAVEKLRAYAKCQSLQVKGIYEDCNNEICDNCDLCYMQGTTGEHCEAIDIAIQALENKIATSSELKAYRANATEMKYKPICLGKAYDCGVCRAFIGFYGDNNYCWNCGKKIDWEGAERGEENE